ncbi:MAG TPA: hypothetical protein VL357_07910 [Rariglobus sp.]|jgi:hypothetical protein|nr:hypothetical protein [Rariglobus sp.]
MHAQHELNHLALRKRILRRRITVRREECAAQIAVVVRPLGWLDEARAKWNRVSPAAKIAALPLGFLLRQAFFPKARLLGSLLRWAPVAMTFFRSVR